MRVCKYNIIVGGVRGPDRTGQSTGGISMFVINISRVIIIGRPARQQPACQSVAVEFRSAVRGMRTHKHTHTH